jgi:hypothetical protein
MQFSPSSGHFLFLRSDSQSSGHEEQKYGRNFKS